MVAAVIDQDEDFLQEIRRLANSFGIGLIRLDVNNPDDSETIIQATKKDILDIEMINIIVGKNPDFREFIKRIKTDLTQRKFVKKNLINY
ncbi:hypothetical protein AGMMS50229_19830 [Campylobacterota bacterium]|nr:hypothetical protein AGMMS50229_19830 [Campylobacterota bacterium]